MCRSNTDISNFLLIQMQDVPMPKEDSDIAKLLYLRQARQVYINIRCKFHQFNIRSLSANELRVYIESVSERIDLLSVATNDMVMLETKANNHVDLALVKYFYKK